MGLCRVERLDKGQGTVMRQIVLDTETTGLDPAEGHRIIEVGCVELVNRRLTENRYHVYLNPDREIDQGAIEVHGINNQFLEDKPRYADIADDLLTFLKGAELIIHNAAFDMGFLNSEFKRFDAGWPGLESHCRVTDTLLMARKLHPGQKNNLDALCKRYFVDNSQRDLHGALLDAEILADVYLAMTGGQTSLGLGQDEHAESHNNESTVKKLSTSRPALRVITASDAELQAHESRLAAIEKASGQVSVWHRSRAQQADEL